MEEAAQEMVGIMATILAETEWLVEGKVMELVDHQAAEDTKDQQVMGADMEILEEVEAVIMVEILGAEEVRILNIKFGVSSSLVHKFFNRAFPVTDFAEC